MVRGPVAALVLAATALYLVLALRSPLPVLFPDEVTYAHLARSLADGQGMTWRGQPISQLAALYVYLLVPPWGLLGSTVDAFAASKVLGTLALCGQALAVWALARSVLRDERLALLPTALVLAGTWMTTAAGTTTEALAFPLATAGLCALVAALRRPGAAWGWLALALVIAAAWARIQLAVLVIALAAALVADVLRVPRWAERRARLRAHAPLLVVSGALSVVGLIAALAAPSLTGGYAGLLRTWPPLHRTVGRSGLELLEVVTVCGLLPFVLTLAATLTPRAWRDDDAGPLLAVVWPVIATTVLESGLFLAGFLPAQSGIQRYVFYAVPLLLVLAVLVAARPGLVGWPALAAATGATVLGLLARPAVEMIGEERAMWSTSYRVHQVLGVGTGPALALVALAMAAAFALLTGRSSRRGAAVGVTAVILGVLAVQSQASWHQLLQTTRTFRTVFPADLAWIDDHSDGPVADLALTQVAPQFADLELFNRRLSQAYAPASGVAGPVVPGRRCAFRFALSGALVADPHCGPAPRRFLLGDPAAAVTFRDEVRSVSDPTIGRLVELAPGATPRARSVLILACPRASPVFSAVTPDIVPADAPRPCAASFSASLWLRRPGALVLRFAGGRATHALTVAGRRYVLPAGRTTTVRLPVAAGYSQHVIGQDWTSTGGAPRLVGATLRDGTTTTPIL